MHCPLCADETLVPVVRHGVELDFCPRCKGVWLDRGELESLLDVADGIGATYSRSGPEPAASAPAPPRRPPPPVVSPPAPPRQPPPPRAERSDRSRDGRDRDGRDRDDRDRDRDDRNDRDYRSSRRRKKRKNKFSDMLDDVFDFDFD